MLNKGPRLICLFAPDPGISWLRPAQIANHTTERERDRVEPKVQSNGQVIAAAASPPVWHLNPAYIGDHMRSVVVSKHCNHTTASHNHWMQGLGCCTVFLFFFMGFVHYQCFNVSMLFTKCIAQPGISLGSTWRVDDCECWSVVAPGALFTVQGWLEVISRSHCGVSRKGLALHAPTLADFLKKNFKPLWGDS